MWTVRIYPMVSVMYKFIINALVVVVLASAPCTVVAQSRCVLPSGYLLTKATKLEWTVEKDGVTRRGKWDSFPASESEAVRKFWSRRDVEQFEKVRSQLTGVHQNPQAVGVILQQLHRDFPESPYAGLWAGVVLAASDNDAEAAERILFQARERVETQQMLAPEYHRLTLASIYNNLAICEVKQQNGNSAAGYLIKALEVNKYATPVVRHNINQLIRFSEAKSGVSFGSGVKAKLLSAFTSSMSDGVDSTLEDGWHYSLDFDVPEYSSAARKIHGLEVPAGDIELLSIGTGVVLSDGIVVTARPNIEIADYSGPLLVTVCYQAPGGWTSLRAENVLVESLRSVPTGGRVAQGPGGTSHWSDFRYVLPVEGTPAAQVAALRVNGLPLKPAFVGETGPVAGEKVRLMSFSRTDRILEDGLRIHDYEISKSAVGSGRRYEISGQLDGGARGAPVANREGAVVGITFDYADQLKGALGGQVFGIDEIRTWFYRHVQTSELTTLVPNSDDAAARLRQATVPVLSWGVRQRTMFSKISDDSRPSGGVYLIDGWCVSCDGKGAYKCLTCAGNGRVTERKKEQVAFDPKFGPIYATKAYFHTCPTCNGARFHKCPYCKAGRIRP